MKVLFIAVAFLVITFLQVNPSHAKLWVIHDSSNKVISISSQDDAQLESGQTKLIIQGSRQSLGLDLDADMYKVVGNTIAVDGARMAEEAQKEQDEVDRKNQKVADRASATAKLIVLGLTNAEIDALR